MTSVNMTSPNYARLVKELETYGGKELRAEMTGAITKKVHPARDEMRRKLAGSKSEAKPTGGGKKDREAELKRLSRSASRRQRAEYNLSRSKAYENAQANARFLGAKGRRKVEAMQRRAIRGAGLTATLGKKTYLQANNRASGPRAGVRIATKNSMLPPEQRILPRLMNRGRWKHPVFGNHKFGEGPWVEQTSTASGWWTMTLKRYRPLVRAEIEREMLRWKGRLIQAVRQAEREGLPKQRSQIAQLKSYT